MPLAQPPCSPLRLRSASLWVTRRDQSGARKGEVSPALVLPKCEIRVPLPAVDQSRAARSLSQAFWLRRAFDLAQHSGSGYVCDPCHGTLATQFVTYYLRIAHENSHGFRLLGTMGPRSRRCLERPLPLLPQGKRLRHMCRGPHFADLLKKRRFSRSVALGQAPSPRTESHPWSLPDGRPRPGLPCPKDRQAQLRRNGCKTQALVHVRRKQIGRSSPLAKDRLNFVHDLRIGEQGKESRASNHISGKNGSNEVEYHP